MICSYRFFRKALLLLFISGFTGLAALAQKPAYKLFREDGKKVRYEKMLDAAMEADIVLFGEYHTNPISHWLQLELTTDLYELRGDALILGAEMFEADNQLIMDEYLSGMITEKKFEEEARLWNNYKTDYKPLVLIAKENNLTFVATNIPRRYANMVFKKGKVALDSLSDEALSYMAPLPLQYDTSLNCYRQMMGSGSGPTGETKAPMGETKNPMGDIKKPTADTLAPAGMTKAPMGETSKPTADTLAPAGMTKAPMGEAMPPMGEAKAPMGEATPPMGGHGSTNLADAQAIKDATMSHFIMEYWEPGKVFIHYNGAYHSDEFESMNWFLKRARPDLKILTISTVSQEDVEELEEESTGKADFIIAVPETMTQTGR